MIDFGPADRSPDLVFLHANGFNALTYRRILAPLAARFRVLGFDLRGHGASTLPAVVEGRTGWDDFRDDLVVAVAELDVRAAVLAGHSMGGATALAGAALAPFAARRLVLFDPVLLPRNASGLTLTHNPLLEAARRRRAQFPSRRIALHIYRGRRAFADWPDDMLADYVEGGFRHLPGGGVRLACEPAWEASNFANAASDPWPILLDPPCPVDIIRAERDSTCRTDGEEAVLAAHGVSVEVVPGTSHFLPMQRPELATERLRRALESD